MFFFTACDSTVSKNSNYEENENVLRLSDIPQFDTTGLQSIYREVSPYEVKGIEPPEDRVDELYERYSRPYSHFEFIENAHGNLASMGYDVGSITEFSFMIIQDSLYASNAFEIMKKHSTKSYLGSKDAFIDSVRNARIILDSLVIGSDHKIHEIDWSEIY